MTGRTHRYNVRVEWTGNLGTGTSGYRDYSRAHEISAEGKPTVPGSSDPAFRGDKTRWNPEDLLVASASACHKLWYLHLCAAAGVRVVAYRDDAGGEMREIQSGSGRFVRIVLRPVVTIASGGDLAAAARLHHEAHKFCFIANSVNFPIECEPSIRIDGAAAG